MYYTQLQNLFSVMESTGRNMVGQVRHRGISGTDHHRNCADVQSLWFESHHAIHHPVYSANSDPDG